MGAMDIQQFRSLLPSPPPGDPVQRQEVFPGLHRHGHHHPLGQPVQGPSPAAPRSLPGVQVRQFPDGPAAGFARAVQLADMADWERNLEGLELLVSLAKEHSEVRLSQH